MWVPLPTGIGMADAKATTGLKIKEVLDFADAVRTVNSEL